MGGSSNIDATTPGDVDDTNGWEHASDGTLETRQYLLQNWRADVVAVIDSKADPIEYVRYSAYGMPYVYAAGDMNRDGVCDSADEDAWNDLWNSGTGTARVSLDVNRDGAVSDSDDLPLVQTQIAAGSWASSGRGVLSRVGVRKGYAGYEWDPVIRVSHIRNRVYHSEIGRWGRRDPLGYVDTLDLYEYVRSMPLMGTDEDGLVSMVGNPCRAGCEAIRRNCYASAQVSFYNSQLLCRVGLATCVGAGLGCGPWAPLCWVLCGAGADACERAAATQRELNEDACNLSFFSCIAACPTRTPLPVATPGAGLLSPSGSQGASSSFGNFISLDPIPPH